MYFYSIVSIKVVCPVCPVYNDISLLIWSRWVALENLFAPAFLQTPPILFPSHQFFTDIPQESTKHLTLISFYPFSGIDKSPRGRYWSIVVVITPHSAFGAPIRQWERKDVAEPNVRLV